MKQIRKELFKMIRKINRTDTLLYLYQIVSDLLTELH